MGILEDLAQKDSVERVTGQPAVLAPVDHVRKRQQIMAGKASAEAEAAGYKAEAWRGALKTLPDVGGTVGSLFGPAGAGVGAGLGETAYQGAKAAAGEGFDAKRIGMEAGLAAGGQKIGQLAGKVPNALGGVITGETRKRAVAAATREYEKAAARGVAEPTIALTQGIPKLLQRAGAAGQREVDDVLREYRNFMSNKPQSLSPVDLHEIRQVMDDIAKPYYDAVGKFKPPPDPAIAAQVRFAKQVADNARESLRNLVPEATKYEAQASRAIRARKFIPIGSAGSLGGLGARTAIAGTMGAYAGGLPGGTAASLAMLMASQPAVAMAIGKMLSSGSIPATLGQAGRVVGQASQ